MSVRRLPNRLLHNLLPVSLLVTYVIVLIRTAWMCDDAFITLRTVDNFVRGYGLVWNIGERVQAYTHPLWMFVLSFFYAFTLEPYYTTLAVSMALSLCAVCMLLWMSRSSAFTLLLLGIMLIGSKAFVDYSTSGLENPLAYLLLVIFFATILRRQQPGVKEAFALGAIAGLIMLNRLDHGLLVIPALLVTALSAPRREGLIALLLASAPIVIWSIFSLIYYGFPFPNTFYAKQASGIPRIEYINRGLSYIADTAVVDGVTILGILLGIAVASVQRRRIFLATAVGVLLYVCYVLWIGGDFMGGRMFSAPFVSALAILAVVKPVPRQLALKLVALLLSIIPVALNRPYLLSEEPRRGVLQNSKPAMFGVGGVADERVFGVGGVADERVFYDSLWLLPALQGKAGPDTFRAAQLGRLWREHKGRLNVRGTIGAFGYYAGQQTYIIDPWALSDAFLARIGPRPYPENWRIGHISRPIPDGYLMTKLTGENRLRDPELARLYDQLRLVTSGHLFDARRWSAIIDLNTRPLPFAFLDSARVDHFRLDHFRTFFRGDGVSLRPGEQLDLILGLANLQRRLFVRAQGGYRIQFKRQAAQVLVEERSIVAEDGEQTIQWFDVRGFESVHISTLTSQQRGLVVYFALLSPSSAASPQVIKTDFVEFNVHLDNFEDKPETGPLWLKKSKRGLVAFLKADEPITHTLAVQAWPLCPPGKTQSVKLWLNGQQIAEYQWTNCSERWVEQIQIPAERLLPGWNLLEAEGEHGAVPAQIIPGSKDKRTLYVAFERLFVQPIQP